MHTELFGLEDARRYDGRRFGRMALVSSVAHIETLQSRSDDTLFVSCDWLTWQTAVTRGIACIHYEAGLTGDDPENLMSDLYIKASDWIYVDGVDVTQFRDVSLGRKFFKETGLAIFEYHKLDQTFRSLLSRFGPKEIIYFDYRTDLSFLNEDDRYELVSEIAISHGCNMREGRDRSLGETPNQALQASYDVAFANGFGWSGHMKSNLQRAVEIGLDFVSKIRSFFGGKKVQVLMLNTHLTAIPLIERYRSSRLRPLFIGINFPNKRKLPFVLTSLLKGIYLVARPDTRLPESDAARIDDIARLWTNHVNVTGNGVEKYVARYVRDRILGPRRLHRMAHTVLWADKLLAKHNPDRVVTDGLQNATYCTFLELSRKRGIPTAVTWHGHYLIDMKLETLGGDSRVPPLADYCLSWGEAQDSWLVATNSKTKSIRTGNPISAQHNSVQPVTTDSQTALVLQYAPLLQDLHAPQSQAYNYFVDVVGMLQDLGYTDICFRLHPGHARVSYYRDIAQRFGLNCEISDSGPFRDVLASAGFVIGPVTTGAMFEALGAGKTYYPLLLEPHSMNVKYLENGEVFSSVAELRTALAEGKQFDQQGLLDDFFSQEKISDPATRMWNSILYDMSAPLPS